MAAAVSSTVAGRGGLLLLAGEPGIGKTTAARDLIGLADDAGAGVVWSACSPDDQVAHGPWLTVLAALGAEPSDAAIHLATGDDPGDGAAASAARAGAYERVMITLASCARDRPLVIVIDDLHWSDDGTLRLLRALHGRLPAVPLLIVGTYRDAEVPTGSPLSTLAESADRLTLTGLVSEEVAQLLTEVLGAQPDSPTVADVCRRTGGNPFLVLQVARLLASGSHDALPAGTRDLLGRRLGALSDDARAVLAAAATLGSPFRAATVAAVVDLDSAEVLGALDQAAAVRVVERLQTAGDWSFVHDLFRAAVLDALPTAAAATLHVAGRVLAEAGAEPAVVASHLLAGSTGPDPSAASWSIKAAERALGALAWEEAVGHAERALAALPVRASGAQDPSTRVEYLLVLGRGRLLAGDEGEAGNAFADVARLARSVGSGDLLARAALGFAADLGGFEVRLFDQRQIDLLEEAAASLARSGPASSHGMRARVLARLSVALSFTASTERRLALAEQAVALARSVGDPLVLAGALAAHCDAIAGPDDIDRRLAESMEVIELASAAGDGGLELLGRRLRFVAVLEAGDTLGAEREAAAFARRADAVGNPLYSWYVTLWQGMRLLADGDIAAAEAAADEVRLIGKRAGSTNAPMLATVLLAEVMYEAGRGTELGVLFNVMKQELAELFDEPQAAGADARYNLARGMDARAQASLDRLQAGVDRIPRDAEWLPAMASSLEAAVILGHPILESLVHATRPYAHRFAFEGIGAGLHGSLARPLAAAESALGNHDDAVSLARQALEANRPVGALVRARSQRVLGDALNARGNPDDAEEAARFLAMAEATITGLGLHEGGGTAVTSAPTLNEDATSLKASPTPGRPDAELCRDGDVWHIAYGGRTTIVRHGKGIADLAVLLTMPDREVHVTELETLPPAVAATARTSSRDDALDGRAVAEYRSRLAEWEADISEADAANDSGRAERSRVERDFIVDELTASFGLGGRARSTGPDPVERLRKAVTARLRDAIRRIESVHPPLGRHLSNSVRTGTFCSYSPEQPVIWRCETRSGGSRA